MKKGKFEIASGGSILLDEIGDMDLLLQAKLLRVLEEKEFERVGGNRLFPANTRIIATTNANLADRCADKSFREDLYYRLNALELHLPPLRQIKSDIPQLAAFFIKKENLQIQFDTSALTLLTGYSWPGNVRQLKNLIRRFGVLKNGEIIHTDDLLPLLPRHTAAPNNQASETQPPNPSLSANEMSTIRDALNRCGQNQSKAARELGISRSTIRRKVLKYKL